MSEFCPHEGGQCEVFGGVFDTFDVGMFFVKTREGIDFHIDDGS